MTDDDLLELLHDTADAVTEALRTHEDWSLVGGERDDEYKHDVVADAAALEVLTKAPVGILSEESGLRYPDRDVVVVIDPVDGSSNASHRLPWFATSLCAVDRDGPLAAVVKNQATGTRYAALRGRGATVDGERIAPPTKQKLSEAFVALSGMPPHHLGWRQYRALGASALDMCAVANGTVDAFIDCTPRPAHGPWDYLGALLVCHEAGAVVVDRYGEDLVVLDHTARRSPIAAATPELMEQILRELHKKSE
ncbi:MAG: monophosphatase [Actinomycetota bacterium]|jgi:fructose-1,6-bisphosphatase/inositol monophosphatase family enzyme